MQTDTPRLTEAEQERYTRLDNAIRDSLATVKRSVPAMIELGEALCEMKAMLEEERGGAYRPTSLCGKLGFAGFEDYCEKRHSFGKRAGNYWIETAQAAKKLLGSVGNTLPSSARQIRSLVKVPEEYRGEVLDFLGSGASAAVIEEAAEEITEAAREEEDREEKLRKEREALERWKREHDGKAQHRQQRGRLERVEKHGEAFEKTISTLINNQEAYETAQVLFGLFSDLGEKVKPAGVRDRLARALLEFRKAWEEAKS